MTGSQHSFVAAVRRCLANPAALGYLAVVAGVLAWVGLDALLVEHQDASLAGIWAFLVTGPTSWLFLMLPGVLPWAGVVVGALVLGLILGARAVLALVNERDIGQGLFTPDVSFPSGPLTPDEYVFFSRLPQALFHAADGLVLVRTV